MQCGTFFDSEREGVAADREAPVVAFAGRSPEHGAGEPVDRLDHMGRADAVAAEEAVEHPVEPFGIHAADMVQDGIGVGICRKLRLGVVFFLDPPVVAALRVVYLHREFLLRIVDAAAIVLLTVAISCSHGVVPGEGIYI